MIMIVFFFPRRLRQISRRQSIVERHLVLPQVTRTSSLHRRLTLKVVIHFKSPSPNYFLFSRFFTSLSLHLDPTCHCGRFRRSLLIHPLGLQPYLISSYLFPPFSCHHDTSTMPTLPSPCATSLRVYIQ